MIEELLHAPLKILYSVAYHTVKVAIVVEQCQAGLPRRSATKIQCPGTRVQPVVIVVKNEHGRFDPVGVEQGRVFDVPQGFSQKRTANTAWVRSYWNMRLQPRAPPDAAISRSHIYHRRTDSRSGTDWSLVIRYYW